MIRHPHTVGAQRAHEGLLVDARTGEVRVHTRAPTQVSAWDDKPRARRGRGKKSHRR